MKTVRDLRQEVLRRVGSEEGHTDFCSLSPEHARFWDKLHQLGWLRRKRDPEDCFDVDGTATLTDEEWNKLLSEFESIAVVAAA